MILVPKGDYDYTDYTRNEYVLCTSPTYFACIQLHPALNQPPSLDRTPLTQVGFPQLGSGPLYPDWVHPSQVPDLSGEGDSGMGAPARGGASRTLLR